MGFVVYKGQSAWDLRSTKGNPRGICSLRKECRVGFVVSNEQSAWVLWSTKGSSRGICGLQWAGHVELVVYTVQSVWNLWSTKWQCDSFSPSTYSSCPLSVPFHQRCVLIFQIPSTRCKLGDGQRRYITQPLLSAMS